MKPEDRLRDAIKTYTDHIDPGQDAWTRIREQVDAREIRRRRFGGWQLGFACAAAAAVVVVGVVVGVNALRSGGGGEPAPPIGGGQQLPARIVAVNDDGKVVVLASRDGRVVRTLARGADQATTVAVTPDARRVYFDRETAPSAGCRGREIVSVPVDGADTERVALGSSPMISPDGRHLVFLDACGAPTALVVTELGDARREVGRSVADAAGMIDGPSWALDSRTVAYAVVDATSGSSRVQLFDVDSRTETSGVMLPSGVRWQGYFGTIGAYLGVQGRQAVVLDPRAGAVLQVLFEVGPADSVRKVVSDSLGDNVLAVVSSANGTLRLERWVNGESKTRKVADGIVAAAWVPDRTPTQADEGAP